MGKKDAAPAVEESKGRAVILPNGVARVDYIRDAYYDKKTGIHDPETCEKRGPIKNAINEMNKEAGIGEIAYQIVFAATKTKEDPRIAAATRAEERQAAKAAKEKDEADAKVAEAKARGK